jgi:hypothetical protein
MLMKWAGFTQAHYETIRKTVNWEGNHPKGAVFHVAAFDKDGGRVTDIWESAEEFNDFVHNRLMPGTKAAGITGEPQVEIFPVYAIFAPVALNKE